MIKTFSKKDIPENLSMAMDLKLRYLCGMPWEEVAEVMDYSYVHIVHRLHPKALEKFKEVV